MKGDKRNNENMLDREVIDLLTVMGINGDKGVGSRNNEGIKYGKGGRVHMKEKTK